MGVDPKNEQLEINLYYTQLKVISIEYIYVPTKIMLKIIHLNNTTNICPNMIVRVCVCLGDIHFVTFSLLMKAAFVRMI